MGEPLLDCLRGNQYGLANSLSSHKHILTPDPAQQVLESRLVKIPGQHWHPFEWQPHTGLFHSYSYSPRSNLRAMFSPLYPLQIGGFKL